MIYIGIDPGVKTGFALIDDGKYKNISTYSILEAIGVINHVALTCPSDTIILYVENPNLRIYFGDSSREVLQGAGSIKRDYSIWKEFAKENELQMIDVHPKNVGSIFDNVTVFKSATGWKDRTSQHARDAARMIFKHYKP